MSSNEYDKISNKTTNRNTIIVYYDNGETNTSTSNSTKKKCLCVVCCLFTLVILVGGYFAYQYFDSSTINVNDNSSTKQSVWMNPTILANEDSPYHDTIYGKYIVSYDLECLTRMEESNRDIIHEFVNLFECYSLNETVVDQFPTTTDRWIYMEQEIDCASDDEVEIVWDDYCISDVEQDEWLVQTGNECVYRSTDLWNLYSVTEAIGSTWNPFQYIKYDPTYNPNMDIIVMDSGIDASHSQFTGITIERIRDEYPQELLHRHGTHVAGTIIGEDCGAFVASTQTRLIDVRSLNSTGEGTLNGLMNGYNAIINHMNKNSGKKFIINLSFGHGFDKETNDKMTTIKSKGGIVFAAAGNSNTNASNISPASAQDVITVGNVNKFNIRADSSNYGDSIDIWAPGEEILSAFSYHALPDLKLGFYSGTSMSAPLVAGIAANILANTQSLDFDGVKKRLLDYAVNDVNDLRGNTNLPRVQIKCKEYCTSDSSCSTESTLTEPADDKTLHIACGSGTIVIKHATFGENCGATTDNELVNLATVCDSKNCCSYTIDLQVIDDPAPVCEKSYTYEYICSVESSIIIRSSEESETLNIDCGGPVNGNIVITSAYDKNCGVTVNNKLNDLADECNGKKTCNYTVVKNVADSGCTQTFSYEYICGSAEAPDGQGIQGYTIGPGIVYWDEAQSYCKGLGKDLASISSAAEYNEAKALCQTKDNTNSYGCWIGLTYASVSGSWEWTDGTPLSYGFDCYGNPTTGVYPWGYEDPNGDGTAVNLHKDQAFSWIDGAKSGGNGNWALCNM
eukprot:28038_1